MMGGNATLDWGRTLGLPLQQVAREMLGGIAPEHVVGSYDWLVNPDAVAQTMIAAIPACVPASDRAQLEATMRSMADAVVARVTLMDKFISMAAGLQAIEENLRANSGIGLYIHDVGEVVAPGGPYDLRPRLNGDLQDQDLQFKEEWVFLRIVSHARDVAAGFSLAGGQTFGFANEGLKPFPFDFPLAAFLQDADPATTPLASLIRRSPKQDIPFVGKVILDAATDQSFYGLNLEIYSKECSLNLGRWSTRFGDMSVGDLTATILATAGSPAAATPLTPQRRPLLRPLGIPIQARPTLY